MGIAMMLSRTKIMTPLPLPLPFYMELRIRESAVDFCFLSAENVKNTINKPFLDFNKLDRKTIYIYKSNYAFFLIGFPWKLNSWFSVGAHILKRVVISWILFDYIINIRER